MKSTLKYFSIISSLLFIPSLITAEELVISHSVPLSSLPGIASHSEKITLATSIAKNHALIKLVDYLNNHSEIESKAFSEKEWVGVAAGTYTVNIVENPDKTGAKSVTALVKPEERSAYIEKIILRLISDSP